MLIECSNCGAPLDVQARARVVSCRYCGCANRVAETRTLAIQTPANFTPPATWTPPAQARAPARPHPARRSGRGAGCLIGFALMIALVGAAGVGVLVVGQAGGLGPLLWDGSEPLVCGLNEQLVLEGKQISMNGTAFEAMANCQLTLRDCDIEADQVVSGAVNATVRLERSRVHGRRAGVQLGVNGHLFMVGHSRLTSEGVGVTAPSNLSVQIAHGEIDAATAIQGGSNLTVDAQSALLRGSVEAIRAASNAKLNLTGSRVEGPTAITAGSNLALDASQGTVIHGNDRALVFESNGAVRAADTQITAGGIAITGGSNHELVLREVTVRGEALALSLPERRSLICDPCELLDGTAEQEADPPAGDAARVTIGEIELRGGLSVDAAQRVLRSHAGELGFCLERTATTGAGNMSIRVVVDSQGRTQSAHATPSAPRALSACITGAVRRWRFPAPTGGGVVILTLPVSWHAPATGSDGR